MQDFFTYVGNQFTGFSWLDALDILIMTVLLYLLFAFFKKYNATVISKCLVIVVIFAALTTAASLSGTSLILKGMLIVFLVFVVVIFAMEIKRSVWKFSSAGKGLHTGQKLGISEDDKKKVISEIVRACLNMAKNDIGAIIVIVQDSIPKHIIDSGVILNSSISSQLIESIFNTQAPLHDGAILIMGNRIIAAGCFLPLSQELSIPKDLGTRHRAGIGISEAQQVMSIVVSEETGIISVAENGKLKRYVDGKTLADTLSEVYNVH